MLKMKYIFNEEDREPAMRYEGIVRYAYDCERVHVYLQN
jgi:hypothetical protein